MRPHKKGDEFRKEPLLCATERENVEVLIRGSASEYPSQEGFSFSVWLCSASSPRRMFNLVTADTLSDLLCFSECMR
jgi:hypothetical protein